MHRSGFVIALLAVMFLAASGCALCIEPAGNPTAGHLEPGYAWAKANGRTTALGSWT